MFLLWTNLLILTLFYQFPKLVVSIIKIRLTIPEEPVIDSKIGNLQEQLPQRMMAIQSRLVFVKMEMKTSDYVNISPRDGDITVKKRIDKEQLCPKKAACQMMILINCNNGQGFVELLELTIDIIDINDNRCNFIDSDQQTITWPENSRKFNTKESLNRPEDLDTSFSIRRSDIRLKSSSNLFRLKIQEIPSLIRPFNLDLVLIGDLDYELKQRYHLVIEAGDGQTTCSLNVIVEVSDINDNSPIFPSDSYQTEIPENFPLNKSFYKVTAKDKDSGINAEIFYVIDIYADKEIRKLFGINETGEIFLKSKLNFYDSSLYKIPIIARNVDMLSKFGTTQVVVTVTDVNDQYPVISVNSAITGNSNVTILEEQRPGNDVGMVTVRDNDSGINARISCDLIDQSLPNSLVLRQTNSFTRYRLVTNRKIDREKVVSIAMKIVCHDYGEPQLTSQKLLVIYVVDINDNKPTFHSTSLSIKIREDSDPKRKRNNFIIYKFTANDPDSGVNGQIHYSISFPKGPIGDNILLMDYNTGILSSNGKLDREMLPTLSFVVIAKDQGQPQLSNSISVNFTVLDYNDNAPEFSIKHDYYFSLKENNKPNDFIGQFYARDDDVGVNAQLKFTVESGDSNLPFKIYSKKLTMDEKKSLLKMDYDWSIDIFTVESIDRESLINSMNTKNVGFEFLVRAQDGGIPRKAKRVKLRILVVDENDNAPHFTFPSMNNSQLTLSYQQRKSYRFGKINAVDSDNGINGTVKYKLQDPLLLPKITDKKYQDSSKITQLFSLDANSGDLTLARSLSRSDIGIYRLTIIAYDRGLPPLSTTQTLEINIDKSLASNSVGSEAGYSNYYSSLGNLFNSDQAINLYIIIAIIVASTIISVVMLSAICIVLKKSRRQRMRRSSLIDDNPKSEQSIRHGNAPSDTCSLKLAQSSSLLALAHIHDPILPYPNNNNNNNNKSNINMYSGTSTLPHHSQSQPSPINQISTAFLNTLSNGHINSTPRNFSRHIITPYSQALLNTEIDQQCSNASTDLDSGKGDSVDVHNHPRFMCPLDPSSSFALHQNQFQNYPLESPLYDTNNNTNNINNNSDSSNTNRDMYGYFKPRFFHLSHTNPTGTNPTQLMLSNTVAEDEDLFNTSYI